MSDIYLSITETPTVVTLSAPVISGALSSTVTVSNVVSVNVVTMPAINVTAAGGLTNAELRASAVSVAVTTMPALSISSVSISNFPASQTVAGTVTANQPSEKTSSSIYSVGSDKVSIVGGVWWDQSNYIATPIRVGEEGEVFIGSLPPISGTVTVGSVPPIQWSNANGGNAPTTVNQNAPLPVQLYTGAVPSSVTIGAIIANSVTIGSLPAISGTVTANVAGNLNGAIEQYDDNDNVSHKVAVQIYGTSGQAFGSDASPLPVRGTITVGNSVTIGSLPAISGTVTANNPSGALTTRFGSVTTANTAQITSAVTNTSRKYLLAQNISAGTVTIGIGFSPTTTQGIQLTAGGGLTFDAFCPTGAVYWLGAVTGAAFTILEG
jgi:hypothetical protein